MRTLDYYGGKKSDDPVDAECSGPSLRSDLRQPAINIVIGKRPRKAPHPKRLAKLVDYSSSQEEPADERDELATSKRYSIGQKKSLHITPDIIKPLDTLVFITRMFKGG